MLTYSSQLALGQMLRTLLSAVAPDFNYTKRTKSNDKSNCKSMRAAALNWTRNHTKRKIQAVLATARPALSLLAAKHLPPHISIQLGTRPTERWRQVTADSSPSFLLLYAVLHTTLPHQFTDVTRNVGLYLANA